MIKNLTLAVLSAIILSSFTPTYAFDYKYLNHQVKTGKITKQESKKIVNRAVRNGDISKKEMKAYKKQMKQHHKNKNKKNYNYKTSKNHTNYKIPNHNIPNYNDRYSHRHPKH